MGSVTNWLEVTENGRPLRLRTESGDHKCVIRAELLTQKHRRWFSFLGTLMDWVTNKDIAVHQ